MKDLYKKLAELEPDRFTWYGDDEHDGELWQFDDDLIGSTVSELKDPLWWLQRSLNQEGVTRIDRAEGQTWEEAMLTALVEAVERRVMA